MLAIALDLVQILIQWSQAVLRKLVPGSSTQGLVHTPLAQLPAAGMADPGLLGKLEPHGTNLGKPRPEQQSFSLWKSSANPWGTERAPASGCPSLAAPRPPRGEAPQGRQVETPGVRTRPGCRGSRAGRSGGCVGPCRQAGV